jgi:hypothetical protein
MPLDVSARVAYAVKLEAPVARPGLDFGRVDESMHLTTSTALRVSIPRSAVRASTNCAVGTHTKTCRRRDDRAQWNVKAPAAELAQYKAFFASRGISHIEALRIAAAHLGYAGTHGPAPLASCFDTAENMQASATADTQLAETARETPADPPAELQSSPAEVAAMRDELEAVQIAFPRIVSEGRPPSLHDARNVLRHARRAVPDAQPGEIAWHIRRRVMHGSGFRHWGGVVTAADSYTASRQIPATSATMQCVGCGGGIDPAMGFVRDGGVRHFGCA